MNRNSILSFIIVVAGTGALLATTATSQLGAPKAFVSLQPTTPGTSQSGHANVSGTLTAGQLVGGGAGITGVNADLLDGLNSTSFLQSVPVPLTISGTSGSYILWAQNDGALGYGILGNTISSSGGAGVSGQSSGLSGFGVTGQAIASSGNTFGGYFRSFSPAGIGVYGWVSAASGISTGVYGQSDSPSGRGVFGWASGTSGSNYGVYGQSDSPSGFAGFFSGRTLITGNTGIGIAPSGRRFEVNASDINLEAAHINNSQGGGLRVDSASGTAIWALTTNGFAGVDARNGTTSTYAVYGHAYSGTGTAVGVVGQSSSPTGWGVYSFGNMGSTGVKPFRIDHPFDPENKYLLHYSAESPMPQNFYVGNVVTDSQGYAWVELPDYFSEINTNFKYQLTVIGKSFAQAIVYEEIVDGRFQIRTNEPNIKVSWRVDADRNDLYVRDRRPKDVVEKLGRERGTYQHPELYGMPKERGMNYRPEVTTVPPKKVR